MMRVNVGAVDCIPPGEGRRLVLGKRALAVFRGRGGDVFATQATCPHRAGPLAEGLLGGTTIVVRCMGIGSTWRLALRSAGGTPARRCASIRHALTNRATS